MQVRDKFREFHHSGRYDDSDSKVDSMMVMEHRFKYVGYLGAFLPGPLARAVSSAQYQVLPSYF
jgi:hypothetical protein